MTGNVKADVFSKRGGSIWKGDRQEKCVDPLKIKGWTQDFGQLHSRVSRLYSPMLKLKKSFWFGRKQSVPLS